MFSKLFKLVVPSRRSLSGLPAENTSYFLSTSVSVDIEFDICLDASFDCNGVVTDINLSR